MFATWRCTVCWLTTSSVAISRLLRPAATKASTSRSRRVSGLWPSACARAPAEQLGRLLLVAAGVEPAELLAGGARLGLCTTRRAELAEYAREHESRAGALVRRFVGCECVDRVLEQPPGRLEVVARERVRAGRVGGDASCAVRADRGRELLQVA